MEVTPIRPSQFMTRSGPGALTPTVEGSILIPQLSAMVQELLNSGTQASKNFCLPRPSDGKSGLQKFEITDERMVRMLRYFNSSPDKPFEKHIKIFRLPTNADLTIKETQSILKGYIFPKWGICNQHKGSTILMQFSQFQNEITLDCPKCISQKFRCIRGVPVRYVQACTNGHLQDIHWPSLVHKGSNCKNKIFEWIDIGGDNFVIKCIVCNMKIEYLSGNGLKLRSIQGHLPCFGNYPELNTRSNSNGDCSKILDPINNTPVSRARLVLRNSTGLHSPKNLTSVRIPKILGNLHKELFPHVRSLRTILNYNANLDKSGLIGELKKFDDEYSIDTLSEIERTPENELMQIIHQMIEEFKQNNNDPNQKPLSETKSNDEELDSLLEAAKTGFPPSSKVSKKHAYVNIEDILLIKSKEFGVTFRISPIKQLQVIKTQVGYSREVGTQENILNSTNTRIGKLVTNSNHYDDETTRWYLGDESFGEGIFIDIVESNIDEHGGLSPVDQLSSKNNETWNSINNKLEKILEDFTESSITKDELEQAVTQTNPRFVWWHTLCHKLLLNLTVDSGFSIVSFGERVYCKKITKTGKYESGILIYTSATGTDGTLGGLVSLVEKEFMTELFQKSSNGILSCSNDPVCSERKIELHKKEGACCHACELLSETTCNYQNRYLDRNLVKDTIL